MTVTARERRAFSVSVFARHEGRLLLIKHKRLGTWLPVGGGDPAPRGLAGCIRALLRMAKVTTMDKHLPAQEFALRQIQLVIEHIGTGQAGEVRALFADTRKHFYQQAEFSTIDAVEVLELKMFPPLENAH